MLKGLDVSSYQSTSYSTAGLSFVGIKVTEGMSYVNPKWTGQRATARTAGLVTIFYHYPHIANSPAAEADYFLSQINLAAGDVLCLDWEWYGQNVTDAQARAYKDAWLAYAKAKVPGHKVGIYSDTGNWKTVDQNSNCGDFLWIADYTTAGQPRVQHPWTFHQWSDQPMDEDVANFATVADLKAWAGSSSPAPTGAEIYPGASKAHWYSSVYPGDPMQVNTIVWHSTETAALPDYSGGSIAPNLTAVPDFTAQRLVWYQHFGFDESSRALVHAAGQIGTNTLNVAQVEIVGTCDPATHATWAKTGTAHLYMPDLPDWAVRDLGAFARWAHDQHAVPLTSGPTWKPYPASYGNNGVRMSTAAWSAFRGHCGHMHVPENDHGDPGSFPIAAILNPTPTPPPEDDMTPAQAQQLQDLHDLLTSIGSLVETDPKTKQPVPHGAGYYLAHAQADTAALTKAVAAVGAQSAANGQSLTKALAALTAISTAVTAGGSADSIVAAVKAALEAWHPTVTITG